MKNRFFYALSAVCVIVPALAMAQDSSAAPSIPVDEIIRKFAAKEKEFKLARDNYTFRQTIRVMDMGPDGSRIAGKHELTEDVLYDARGRRIEKVVYAPMDTLHNFSMSPEDESDLRNIQPFVLTSDDIGKYNLRYLGKQKVDEIECYLFFVSPKAMVKGERYFEGQIWVDDRDLQIVKTFGKAVPDDLRKGHENIFPKFETYREQIDGKYWFPTYTKADDVLNFSSGAVHIQEIVKYENYKMFRVSSGITFGGEAGETKKPDKPEKPEKP